jgi:transposase
MAPTEIRERRRILRYRNLLLRQEVQCKNKIAQMLMEAGVSYVKEQLHYRGYFEQLLAYLLAVDRGERTFVVN